MKTVNQTQARALWKSYQKGLCDTVTLSELLSIFNLELEEDGGTIFKLLEEHVWYMSSPPNRKDLPSLWRVDYEGFDRLRKYAEKKEELIFNFQQEFLQSFWKNLDEIEKQKAKENKQ